MHTKAQCLAVLFFATVPLLAEIHPKFYALWQKQAPEQLLFTAESVQPESRPSDEYFQTEVVGTVLRVFRSQARIRKTQRVVIRYTVFQPKRDYAGPSPLPYLQKGKSYVVYGKVEERLADGSWLLEPVAGGKSFVLGENIKAQDGF
ncbi:MAG: hypothetical protein NZL89_06885 [Leptospiraceae bacterium]|nr:hypothetical protein [Leptospiraceae bacterium]